MPNPLLRGGQGRTACDVECYMKALVWIAVIFGSCSWLAALWCGVVILFGKVVG